jgi:hypothetical protein
VSDCAQVGFEALQRAWWRFENDPEFYTRVATVRHTIEHLTWPTGEDGLEQMLAAVISVALLAGDADRAKLHAALRATAAHASAKALRTASSWVPDPCSAILLGQQADVYADAAQQIRRGRQ